MRLLSRVLAILRDKHDVRTSDYASPGGKAGKPLSNMARTEVLRRMGRGDIKKTPTPHADHLHMHEKGRSFRRRPALGKKLTVRESKSQ